MVITIDGPAGTGKSTVSQLVAEKLGFDFLDTGAMYRAIALAVLRQNADLQDAKAIAAIARDVRIAFDWTQRPPQILLNGEAVAHLIRGSETTRAASMVAQVAAVREALVREQQRIGREHGQLVTEGRDQGTIVFPDAALKIYLDASPQERARRRVGQLRARGEPANQQEILGEILERDARDAGRSVGPLSVPAGAVIIDTTNLSQAQVVEQIVQHARGSLVA